MSYDITVERSFSRASLVSLREGVHEFWLYTEKNGFVTGTKLRTTNKFFVAATKNFAAATKRLVDRTKHFVVTKYFCCPYFKKLFCWYNKTFYTVNCAPHDYTQLIHESCAYYSQLIILVKVMTSKQYTGKTRNDRIFLKKFKSRLIVLTTTVKLMVFETELLIVISIGSSTWALLYDMVGLSVDSINKNMKSRISYFDVN